MSYTRTLNRHNTQLYNQTQRAHNSGYNMSRIFEAKFIESDEDGDHIICYLKTGLNWDETNKYKVLKPYHLRKSTYHQKTLPYENGDYIYYTYVNAYERKAELFVGSVKKEESQIILENYWKDCIINVTFIDRLLTDINSGGRAWAEKKVG